MRKQALSPIIYSGLRNGEVQPLMIAFPPGHRLQKMPAPGILFLSQQEGSKGLIKIERREFLKLAAVGSIGMHLPGQIAWIQLPGLGIRPDIPSKKAMGLRFVPQKVGTFPFPCDNFCGRGDERKTGTITVTE